MIAPNRHQHPAPLSDKARAAMKARLAADAPGTSILVQARVARGLDARLDLAENCLATIRALTEPPEGTAYALVVSEVRHALEQYPFPVRASEGAMSPAEGKET